MSLKKVKLFYDVLSPYSWFAFETICRYRSVWKMDLQLRPTLLSAVVSKAGNSPPGVVPNKLRYMFQDLQIGAKYFRVPLRPISDVQTTFFEKGSMKPMRFLTAVAEKRPDKLEECSRQLWMRVWGRDEDMVADESISAAGKLAGLTDEEIKEFLAATETPDLKETLKRAVEEAMDKGAFGLPFFVVEDGKKDVIFFGSDRFPQMAFVLGEKWLGPDPTAVSERDGKL